LKLVVDLETLGLNPATDRILCVSFWRIGFDNSPICLIGASEERILKEFWNFVELADEIIGFNSKSFDWSFLLARSMIRGIKIPKNVLQIKHTDLREVVYPYNSYMKGKLQEFAKALNMTVNTENGQMMPIFYEAKEWEKIKAHCNEDIFATLKLYTRCKEIGLIK